MIKLANFRKSDENQTMLYINERISIPNEEFEFTFARSSGPGGQNVNKVSSKAVMRWNVTETLSIPEPVRQRFLARYKNRLAKDGCIVIHGQKYRDQARNMDDCKLRIKALILDVAVPPVKRRPTKPSRGAQKRRLQGKKQNSEKKQNRQKPKLD